MKMCAFTPDLGVSTDPPYYDNIGYAGRSDFFYVWLRRSIGEIYPDWFSTLLTPKAQEVVATPYRFGGATEADGSPVIVRTALALINQTLDEVLAGQEGEFDADTRWAVAWFQQFGMNEGPYGVAETLSKAKDSAVNGLAEAGILKAKAGKVRLLGRNELAGDWDPTTAHRLRVWEVTHQMKSRMFVESLVPDSYQDEPSITNSRLTPPHQLIKMQLCEQRSTSQKTFTGRLRQGLV